MPRASEHENIPCLLYSKMICPGPTECGNYRAATIVHNADTSKIENLATAMLQKREDCFRVQSGELVRTDPQARKIIEVAESLEHLPTMSTYVDAAGTERWWDGKGLQGDL